MTSTAAAVATATQSPVRTQQDRDLRAGRANGMPIGTIERGRRFTFADVDGIPVRGFRSLAEAQRAVATALVVATVPALG